LPGSVQPDDPLAVADKDADPEFQLKVRDVLADAGLRGVESFGDLGHVEIALQCFAQDADLLQIHRSPGG
jgi:hypothetical protein